MPEFADDLLAIEARLVDLLRVMRANVYHPDFGGSFSLKTVAPALVPGFTYADLDVGDGGAASTALEALIVDGKPKDDGARAELQTDTACVLCAGYAGDGGGAEEFANAGRIDRDSQRSSRWSSGTRSEYDSDGRAIWRD